MRPLVLSFSFSLLSNSSRNASLPCDLELLTVVMKILEVAPTSPIVIAEPMRHGRLGSGRTGFSSAIASN